MRLYGDESRGDGDGGRDGNDDGGNGGDDDRSGSDGGGRGDSDGSGSSGVKRKGNRSQQRQHRRKSSISGGGGGGGMDEKPARRRSQNNQAGQQQPSSLHGNNNNSSSGGGGGNSSNANASSGDPQSQGALFEVQLLTLCEVPPRTKLHVGGVVMARSVKYLGRVKTSKHDLETRDTWWIELREEVSLLKGMCIGSQEYSVARYADSCFFYARHKCAVLCLPPFHTLHSFGCLFVRYDFCYHNYRHCQLRAHAQSLCCTHVLGYTETCSIHDDVCVLSCSGTAATLRALLLPSDALMALDRDLARQTRTAAAQWILDAHAHDEEVAAAEAENDNAARTKVDKDKLESEAPVPNAGSGGQNTDTGGGGGDSDANNASTAADGTVDAEFAATSIKGHHQHRNRIQSGFGRSERRASFNSKEGKTKRSSSAGGAVLGAAAAVSGGRRRGGAGDGVRLNHRRSQLGGGLMYGGAAAAAASGPTTLGRASSALRVPRVKPCSAAHVPYAHTQAPFKAMKLVPCALCGRKWVPELLLATVEPPLHLPTRGSGVLLQARVCRPHSWAKRLGSRNAELVSEQLPFVEYELQRQLVLKLKVRAHVIQKFLLLISFVALVLLYSKLHSSFVVC